jgi:hypothetical protein
LTAGEDETIGEGEAIAEDEAARQAADETLAPDGPPRMVLGSYKAGGHTYTMFSDGSVEAHTENGVERFDSMESLRSHLARN